MGIPLGSGYIQYVPAGVRATLSYPTPVQTARDFEMALKSPLFKSLKAKMGEEKVMLAIKEDATLRGSPVMHVLETLGNPQEKGRLARYEYLSGLYGDGMPYNGAQARINFKEQDWDFAALSSRNKPETVLQFVKSFNRRSPHKAEIAWNGGYILNPELVGKLGLPETYIGSPLGMLISAGKMKCPPLFNKPALLIYKDGSIDIRRVNCQGGLTIQIKSQKITFAPEQRNQSAGKQGYFDLMYPGDHFDGNGKVVVRLAGNQVKEIYESGKGEKVPLIPVGLTLVFEREQLPRGIRLGMYIEMWVPGFEDVWHAIEAGPLLLDGGREIIDMKAEGWKTSHSIRTQAARLDYTKMRGPKIAVGINKDGEMVVLTINGRIRESVGATHGDMATILRKQGMEKAMGFDPGGSSTLVVGNRTLNISPYNVDYMTNKYALPPEPRAVSNAIIGFIKR
jgi:hypothetical protein